MAKRRSLLRRVLYLGIVALAIFGAWTLYQAHKTDADQTAQKVVKKVKKVGKVITE